MRNLEIRAVKVEKIILPFFKPRIFLIHIETGDRISHFMSSLCKRTLGWHEELKHTWQRNEKHFLWQLISSERFKFKLLFFFWTFRRSNGVSSFSETCCHESIVAATLPEPLHPLGEFKALGHGAISRRAGFRIWIRIEMNYPSIY